MSRKPPTTAPNPGAPTPAPGEIPFLLYTAQDESVKVRVLVQAETVWLTQRQMAELFDKDVRTINEHIRNIYEEGELTEAATIRNFRIVQTEGARQVTREVAHYNLDVIISVGYRVKSHRGTQFRIWATGVLKEYIKKGFVLDDERLKQGKQVFGEDYFRELLERVRSIRASERRIWQQITDIFAECSIDYDPKSELTQDFFATVQNKFHYAITGQTAAEIIHAKADRSAPNMGLTTWKNAPAGRILPSDVTIAKNYLSEPEIKRLERSVSGFFDYIENLLENRRLFTMAEFVAAVDKFLAFNEYRVLEGRGRVSKKQADAKALAEYTEFNKTQRIESDFDRFVKGRLAAKAEDVRALEQSERRLESRGHKK